MATEILGEHATNVADARMPFPRIASPWFPGPIVLGLERCDPERGAAAIALALARERGARLQLVSVLEPPRDDAAGADARREAARESDRREALGRIAEAAARRDVPCEVAVEHGCAVSLLVERAADVGASLIVLGLRDSGEPLPPFEDETVLRVRRRAPVPLLAVTPDARDLPAVAIAATDFTHASLHAARAAAAVMRSGGTLYLAHVHPDFTTAIARGDGIEWRYGRTVAGAFEAMARDLAVPPGVSVEPVMLEGAPVQALTSFAPQVNAELIAVGTSRWGLARTGPRTRVGTSLIRQRRYSIVAAPSDRAAEELP